MTTPPVIDVRRPRFGAVLTSVLLLIAVLLALTGASAARVGDAAAVDASTVSSSQWLLPHLGLSDRLLDPAFLLTLLVAVLFAWGVLWPSTHPWNVLFQKVVRPRLAPPRAMEDPSAPRFAQGVGLAVVGVGLVLHVLGVPWALVIAAAAAFLAAFLNAAFDFCLGCQLYLLVHRMGLIRRRAHA